MKILVTGIGVSGKSSFRRSLWEKYLALGHRVEHYDADEFQELRAQVDGSCLASLPLVFEADRVYIIEDIHATMTTAVLPLASYDLIFYLRPSFSTYLYFWGGRMRAWFASGYYSWDKNQGWKGTGKKNDWRNLGPIGCQFIRHLIRRSAWINEDWDKLKTLNFQVVRPYLKQGKICFEYL